jgi:NAD(P)-dependent dehydrogenase (short-subunit alcohol dehydrogenase family)
VNNRFADTLFDLSGRAALVTGSSRGIGRAIATRLAQHGADVLINGRKPDKAQAVAESINARRSDGYGRAVAHAGNITNPEDLAALHDAARAAFGRVDILVANAAIHIHVGPSAEMSEAVLEKTMTANFLALHRLSQAVLPDMIKNGFGRIINIASIAALFGSGIYHSYSLSKATAMQYIRNIAVEHGAKNIRANSIAPGLTRTDMAQGLIDDPIALARELGRSTVGRMGEVDEIAGAAVFLASDAGAYVNGQTIAVDGGMTIRYD